jgi:hypothetical protein
MLEMLVRLIGASRERYDGKVLADLFDNVSSENLRWVIGNTIAETKPAGISEWIISVIKNKKFGRDREMFCLAVARQISPEKANKVLREVFEDLPGHSAMGFSECGGAEELIFLKRKLPSITKTWVKKETEKAIKKINKRINKNKQ